MAEKWEVLSGEEKKKKLNDLWAGSIIVSSVSPHDPTTLPSALIPFLVLLFSPLLSVSSSNSMLSFPLSVYSARVLWLTSLSVSGLQLRFLLKHSLQWVLIVAPLYQPSASSRQAWVIKLEIKAIISICDKLSQGGDICSIKWTVVVQRYSMWPSTERSDTSKWLIAPIQHNYSALSGQYWPKSDRQFNPCTSRIKICVGQQKKQ